MAEASESTVVIDAPLERVSRVVADVESYPEWISAMSRATVLDRDAEGRPHEAELVADIAGASGAAVVRYTWEGDGVHEQVSRWSLVRSDKLSALDGEYRLRAVPGGTEVTYRLDARPTFRVPGFLRRNVEREAVRSGLAGLKRHVEG